MKFWFIVLLLGSALGCASTEGLPRGYVISQHNQEAALKYLRPVLDLPGRNALIGSCEQYRSKP
jgi:hypothetical protein